MHGLQAARGTSLNRWIVTLVGVGCYLLDVVVKTLAVHTLDDGDVRVLGDLFVLHLTRNAGAAFSTGTSYTLALSCLAAGALVVVLFLARRAGSTLWAVAFGMLAGGIAGNLTDRIFRDPGPLRGHVVDLFMVPHWPVFNVADVCIDVAAGLILLQAFRNVRLDGSRTVRDEAEEQPA